MFFIIGASGSGKSAVLKRLNLTGHTLLEFDDIVVPENADKKWRQSATEQWLSKILNEYDESHTCLFGQMVLGEILASPSASKLSHINVCFLDCNDHIRIERLKNRDNMNINQHVLNWASWLRTHYYNPQWEQHVIKDNCDPHLNFSVWDQQDTWNNLANINYCDTSYMTLPAVASEISRWILSLNDPDQLHFCKASYKDINIIIDLIKNDPFAKLRESNSEDKSAYLTAYKQIINDPNAYLLVGKIENKVVAVAQINFIANLTYKGGRRAMIEGVRVDETLRNQGIGKKLIRQAVEISKERACCLVQLTTDRQRPDALRFYKTLGFVDSHHGLKLKL